MSGIVDDFMALRRAIARSQHDHTVVWTCIKLARALGAEVGQRHWRAYRRLTDAVSGLITKGSNAIEAQECLDALEVEITQASRAAQPAPATVLRRVGHLALIQGGRAA